MGKLHQIIAVEADIHTVAKKVTEEAIGTFSKRADHFLEKVTSLKMFSETDKNLEKTDVKAMQTTVGDKLSYVAEKVTKYWDVLFQKEEANQRAKADLVVNGEVLIKDAPCTFLLAMENRLKDLRNMYEAIPTLAPGPVWELDPTKGKGVYRQRDADVRMKTEKQLMHKVLVPATDKHPAQIEKWTADVAVGRYVEDVWSAMLTPTQKSDLLGRVDTLIQACKKARQSANETLTTDQTVAAKLFDFIHKGVVTD